jgi:hypothetical protein
MRNSFGGEQNSALSGLARYLTVWPDGTFNGEHQQQARQQPVRIGWRNVG